MRYYTRVWKHIQPNWTGIPELDYLVNRQLTQLIWERERPRNSGRIWPLRALDWGVIIGHLHTVVEALPNIPDAGISTWVQMATRAYATMSALGGTCKGLAADLMPTIGARIWVRIYLCKYENTRLNYLADTELLFTHASENAATPPSVNECLRGLYQARVDLLNRTHAAHCIICSITLPPLKEVAEVLTLLRMRSPTCNPYVKILVVTGCRGHTRVHPGSN